MRFLIVFLSILFCAGLYAYQSCIFLMSCILFPKVRTCIQLYTTGGMTMKDYYFHSKKNKQLG